MAYNQSGFDSVVVLGESSSSFFPLVTQRISIGELDPPYRFGKLYLDLFTPDDSPNQSWIMPVMTALGTYSIGLNAFPLASTCGDAPPPVER